MCAPQKTWPLSVVGAKVPSSSSLRSIQGTTTSANTAAMRPNCASALRREWVAPKSASSAKSGMHSADWGRVKKARPNISPAPRSKSQTPPSFRDSAAHSQQSVRVSA